jgi:hypothetical protein
MFKKFKLKKNSHLRDGLFWYILIITVFWFSMIFWGISKADEVLYNKVKTISPDEVNGQYCFIKVVIKEKNDEIIKEEILECADGKKGIDTPGYWDLFAQFYYRDISAPEYCRVYSRPNHVFKSFGKTCLKQNGEWEVK